MKFDAVLTLVPLTFLAYPATAADKDPFANNAPAVEWMAYSSTPVLDTLSKTASLGDLAKKQSVVGKSGSALGFAEKSPEARFFLAGALYAEALALLQGGEYGEAANRLAALAAVSNKLTVPTSLEHYLNRMQQLIATRSLDQAALVEMLGLLQPIFDDYAGSQSEDKRFLFQTGAWLVDLSLASASGNYTLLKQPVRLSQTSERMRRMDAPKGALDALGEIREIAKQKEIGERDGQRVQRLVRKLQDMLG